MWVESERNRNPGTEITLFNEIAFDRHFCSTNSKGIHITLVCQYKYIVNK